MRLFVLPENVSADPLNSDHVTLSGKDFHYLCSVLRLKKGDSFETVTRTGVRFTAEIETVAQSSCRLLLNNAVKLEQSLQRIELYQCLPKGKKFEQIIRQAVECGVQKIVPVESRYSLIRIDGMEWERKKARYEKIIREAIQQSGSVYYPELTVPIKMKNIENIKKNEIGLFFHQSLLENSSLHEYLSHNWKTVKICIGPEGGLSDKEIDILLHRGFRPVFLGENVLRTETAVVYALGAVQTTLMEKDLWLQS